MINAFLRASQRVVQRGRLRCSWKHHQDRIHRFRAPLMLKLEPGQDDKLLSEVITDSILNLFDTWSESVEQPLAQRAKEISSWFLQQGREETPPVPLSTHPCAFEGKIMFQSNPISKTLVLD